MADRKVSATLPARLGDAMKHHRRAIAAVQWAVVLVYAFLLLVPAALPLPPQGASIVNNLTLFAQFVFWGIWWPGAIASMLLFGRAWCGVLCPEGTLSEFASRHGRQRRIPKIVRWPAWPFVGFLMTTIYGQLISVYEYPKAVLLILGGSTVAAVIVGLAYGPGKRVWCRYLCPVSGVFGILARLSPLHFAVDSDAWERYAMPAGVIRIAPVDCAPMIDIKHMRSSSKCHACGRCSGYRGAVQLALRSPSREIAETSADKVSTPEGLLLVYGMLGVAIGAFQWTVNPMFVSLKQRMAEWLVARDSFLLLQDNAPWWVLTHYPEAGDVFTWLDGLSILGYILGVALAIGGFTHLCMLAGARLAGNARLDWKALALSLTPIAATSLFLGLTMLSVTLLRSEGIVFGVTPYLRAALLAGGTCWSLWLAFRMLAGCTSHVLRRGLAWLCVALPCAAIDAAWYFVFFAR